LYFFEVLFGSNQTIVSSFCLVLTAITVTSVLLLAFAPVALFFLLSSSNYQFFKLLNVAIFAISAIRGVSFLSYGTRIVAASTEGAAIRRRVVGLWVILYAIVGSQMAWTLRPFVGAPSLPFELFRDLGGNFYSNVLGSIGEILGLWVVR
ncbi:MAG: actin-binding WH2 domain-containing protein, partial [Chloroflexi bacterium]|nr:actin-binding WH2 domain-containing protein [Chloroflexota bacterium]